MVYFDNASSGVMSMDDTKFAVLRGNLSNLSHKGMVNKKCFENYN